MDTLHSAANFVAMYLYETDKDISATADLSGLQTSD